MARLLLIEPSVELDGKKGSRDELFIAGLTVSVRRQLEPSGFIPGKEGCSVLKQSEVTACSSCV